MPAGTILPSRGVLDRQRIGESIVATARTHAAEVAARLEETLAPFVAEGETPTDFLALQRQLARYVDHLLATLIEADEAHLRELGDDRDPRRRRDDAAQALYDKLIQLRGALTSLFGLDRGNELLGIEGPTPRDPRLLHRHATRALEQLRAPDPELPTQELNGIQLDRDALAAELQPATDELAAAIQDVTRELREAAIAGPPARRAAPLSLRPVVAASTARQIAPGSPTRPHGGASGGCRAHGHCS